MAFETSGTVRLRGESGPGLAVRVSVDNERLELTAGDEVVGDWAIREIGLHALNEGFAIRAEGEELVLISADDAAFAEEMGMVAATPRLARKVAARHNPPEESPPPPEPASVPTHVGAIAFALAGALVLVGAIFLRTAGGDSPIARGTTEIVEGTAVEFWVAFLVGGLLMVALAYILTLGTGWARIGAILSVAALVILFGVAVSDTATDTSHLTAYGFIAGGLVVGVAVLFSGSLIGEGE